MVASELQLISPDDITVRSVRYRVRPMLEPTTVAIASGDGVGEYTPLRPFELGGDPRGTRVRSSFAMTGCQAFSPGLSMVVSEVEVTYTGRGRTRHTSVPLPMPIAVTVRQAADCR